MHHPRILTLSWLLGLCSVGCGGGSPDGGADGSGTTADATQGSPTSTGPSAPTTTDDETGATQGSASSGAIVPTTTDGSTDATDATTSDATASDATATDGTTSAATATTGASDTGDSTTAMPDTSSTSDTGDDTSDETGSSDATDGTTGEPLECTPRAAVTSEPLVDPKSESRLRLFRRPDGLHLIHMIDLEMRLVKLDPDGAAVGPSTPVADEVWHQVAAGGERYAGANLTTSPQGTKGKLTVVAVQPDDTVTPVGAVALPSEGKGPGAIALQWNPVAGEWGVLWTENHVINPNQPDFVHARLSFGRMTADGAWIDGSKQYLTGPETNRTVVLSDWTNPLIWAGDRYAAVWAEYLGATVDVYLAELTPDGAATRVKIDNGKFSRGVPAWDGAGYGVAWGRFELDHNNLRFAYVEGGAVGPILHLGDDKVNSGEPSIVAADGRFTVSWQQASPNGTRVFYAGIDPVTLTTETVQVTEPDFVGTEWSQSLVHDGCRHALAYMHGLNPSDGWVRLFD